MTLRFQRVVFAVSTCWLCDFNVLSFQFQRVVFFHASSDEFYRHDWQKTKRSASHETLRPSFRQIKTLIIRHSFFYIIYPLGWSDSYDSYLPPRPPLPPPWLPPPIEPPPLRVLPPPIDPPLLPKDDPPRLPMEEPPLLPMDEPLLPLIDEPLLLPMEELPLLLWLW